MKIKIENVVQMAVSEAVMAALAGLSDPTMTPPITSEEIPNFITSAVMANLSVFFSFEDETIDLITPITEAVSSATGGVHV